MARPRAAKSKKSSRKTSRKSKSKRGKSQNGKSRALFDDVLKTLEAALADGVAPWVRPWKTLAESGRPTGAPRSVNGNIYRGGNAIQLSIVSSLKGYTDSRWATYDRIVELGGQVRFQEKSSHVFFFPRWERRMREDERKDWLSKNPGKSEADCPKVKGSTVRAFPVFNVEQAEWPEGSKFGPPPPAVDGESGEESSSPPSSPDSSDFAESQRLLDESKADIRFGGDRASYSPMLDRIALPLKEDFTDAGAFHATALHELTHWTGHESRCDRDIGKGIFGDEVYAFEELVAEMGSALLCAHAAVDGTLQHKEYLAHWLGILKKDKTAFFRAGRKAQEAADFVLKLAGVPVDDPSAEVDAPDTGDLPTTTNQTE